MARQTDTLVTILQMVGATQAANALNAVNNAAQGASKSLITLTTVQLPLTGGMARLNIGTGLLAGGLTALATAGFIAFQALRGIGQIMLEGIRIADQYSQSLARALVLLNNAGRAANPAGLAGLARQRLGAFGIPEERTLNLIGQLGELGFSQQRIGQLVPALQNIEAGTGGRISQERALQLFLRVLERPQQLGAVGRGGAGASRGLLGLATQLGVNIRLTGSFERDLQNLTDAINQKFGGILEATANISSGVHLRYQANLTAALGRLGQLIETVLTPAMEYLTRKLDFFNQGADIILHPGRNRNGVDTALDWLRLVPLFWLPANALRQQRENERQLNQIDPNGARARREQDDIHQIAQNTQQMAGAMVQLVFGHAGSFTRGAFSYNELNRAIGLRR